MRFLLPLALLALAAPARAGQAIELQVVSKAQAGQSKPALILVPHVGVRDMKVRVDCGGAWVEHEGGAAPGERITLEFEPQVGSQHCTGHLSATFDDGSTGDMPLSFDVAMLPPLGITVPRDAVDLEHRTLKVVLDRPAGQVEVTAYGLGGAEVGRGTAPAAGTPPGTPIPVEWGPVPGAPVGAETLRIHVKATDADGFWSAVDLLPWHYEIPHEDVVFETGKAVIRPEEEPKLERAMAEVRKVLDKYGDDVPIKLYVGGYTDTVGDKTMNLALSGQRATAIGRWFQAHGFPGPIYTQGFGERGLAVHTPDETDEPRNRRAVYILAAEAPPVSPQIPAAAWVKL